MLRGLLLVKSLTDGGIPTVLLIFEIGRAGRDVGTGLIVLPFASTEAEGKLTWREVNEPLDLSVYDVGELVEHTFLVGKGRSAKEFLVFLQVLIYHAVNKVIHLFGFDLRSGFYIDSLTPELTLSDEVPLP